MTRIPSALLVLMLAVAGFAQVPRSTSGNPANESPQGESSSKARPDAPPAPSDVPLPPPDATSDAPRKKTGLKGVLDRAAPHCLYAIFSTCWELRSNRQPETAESTNKFQKDMEVGDFYFERHNYRAAGSRYRDALVDKPNDPETTFKLAKSLDKMNEHEQARIAYEAYLMISPDGPHAAESREAMQRADTPSR